MKLLIWYGRLVTRRRLLGEGALLALGSVLWVTLLVVLPLLVMVALAFASRSEIGEVEWKFTFENFRRLAGYGILGWSADYLLILARSVWVAFVTTALCLALSYPLAFFIAGRSRLTRAVLLGLVIVPFCTNLVVRTLGWRVLFERAGLYPGPFAVFVGMVTSELPFALLPLYAVVERLDWSLVEAAQDLYASRSRVFLHAILPQTLPGLAAAIILTFIPTMGAFVVPGLLGGEKYWLVGNLIQQQFGESRDLPFGAAICLALLLLTLAGLFLVRRKGADALA
ncbi:MAG: ABC transporter permease [Planctomycetes bacterium]|nr:ABC transporter permease [Planctomycetota bacterium]